MLACSLLLASLVRFVVRLFDHLLWPASWYVFAPRVCLSCLLLVFACRACSSCLILFAPRACSLCLILLAPRVCLQLAACLSGPFRGSAFCSPSLACFVVCVCSSCLLVALAPRDCFSCLILLVFSCLLAAWCLPLWSVSWFGFLRGFLLPLLVSCRVVPLPVPCHLLWCHTVCCHAVLCCAVPYCVVPCFLVPWRLLPCRVVCCGGVVVPCSAVGLECRAPHLNPKPIAPKPKTVPPRPKTVPPNPSQPPNQPHNPQT